MIELVLTLTLIYTDQNFLAGYEPMLTAKEERTEHPANNFIPALFSVYEDVGRSFVKLGAERNLDFLKNALIEKMSELVVMERMLRETIANYAAYLSGHNEIPDDTARMWVKEAAELGADSKRMRQLSNKARGVIDEIEEKYSPAEPFDREALVIYAMIARRMADLADFMEDVAETQALAAHKPFRECVMEELKAAGIA